MTLERLRDAVAGIVPNAIMPLFWQKGAPLDDVREEMERIGDAGIGAVILEARPHPEFLAEGWWRDVDAVLRDRPPPRDEGLVLRRRHVPDRSRRRRGGDGASPVAPPLPLRTAHGCGGSRARRLVHRGAAEVLGAGGGASARGAVPGGGLPARRGLGRADRRSRRPDRPDRRRRAALGRAGRLVARLLPLRRGGGRQRAARAAHRLPEPRLDPAAHRFGLRTHPRALRRRVRGHDRGLLQRRAGTLQRPGDVRLRLPARQGRAAAVERRGRRAADEAPGDGRRAAPAAAVVAGPGPRARRPLRLHGCGLPPVLRELQPPARRLVPGARSGVRRACHRGQRSARAPRTGRRALLPCHGRTGSRGHRHHRRTGGPRLLARPVRESRRAPPRASSSTSAWRSWRRRPLTSTRSSGAARCARPSARTAGTPVSGCSPG